MSQGALPAGAGDGTPPAMSTPPILPRTHARRTAGLPLRLVAFGSSTTEGSGASSPAHSYPSVMRRTLLPAFGGGIALSNLGVGGENAADMDRRLEAVVATTPDLIVWQTGSNDPVQDVPLERFERLTRAGLDRLAATGADLVLMDQQYCRSLEECPAFPAFREALHRIAAEAGLAVFPRYERMRSWCEAHFARDTLSPDGTHMTDPGYALLGEAVAGWLLDRA